LQRSTTVNRSQEAAVPKFFNSLLIGFLKFLKGKPSADQKGKTMAPAAVQKAAPKKAAAKASAAKTAARKTPAKAGKSAAAGKAKAPGKGAAPGKAKAPAKGSAPVRGKAKQPVSKGKGSK
jgi:DNA-binding protein HU-beta